MSKVQIHNIPIAQANELSNLQDADLVAISGGRYDPPGEFRPPCSCQPLWPHNPLPYRPLPYGTTQLG